VEAVDLRERQRGERRQLIERAASLVFARKGLAAASVADIATEAGFSPGSIYNYFSSKEELLFSATFAEIDELERRMSGALRAPAPPDVQLRRMVEAYHGFYRDRPQGFQLLMAGLDGSARTKVPPEVVERYDRRALDCLSLLHTVVERGMAEGAFREGDAWEMTHAIWGAFHGILQIAAGRDPDRFVGFDVKGLLDRTTDLLIDGIQTGGSSEADHRRGGSRGSGRA
jgi:AcrR family transcriptional regulator